MRVGTESSGEGSMDGFTAMASGGPTSYEDISAPSSPTSAPMDTAPPVPTLPPPTPPPPPTVVYTSVGTDADLEILYSSDVAPGIGPSPTWGPTIDQIVKFLLDQPTLHVDDALRQMLLDPRYPRGTHRDFEALSLRTRTAQDAIRNLCQRCVRAIYAPTIVWRWMSQLTLRTQPSLQFLLDLYSPISELAKSY